MARIKGRNTRPEVFVRKLLHQMGYRFRISYNRLPGTPDIVLPKHKAVILIHGCFWHGHKGCARSARPTTNVDFWNKKIDGNIRRDKHVRKALKALGWRVLVVWQCRIRDGRRLENSINAFLKSVPH